MHKIYPDVITRFLHEHERLILSEEKEMPLVIEAKKTTELPFLQQFLRTHSTDLLEDISRYGAVLLRGFDVTSDEDFENTVLCIKGLRGIRETFMSEEGRIHAGHSKYVLYTNAVYKTGGTLYLGGFHNENYYVPDVPAYISFCCLKPSLQGGETGLINMANVYQFLDNSLKEKLEKNSFFVTKWLVSEVAKRYGVSTDAIEKICHEFDLPIVGKQKDKFILMYKPSVLEHPTTKRKSLFINTFETPSVNKVLRQSFSKDYKGSDWFFHRLVWKLPSFIFKTLEVIYIMCASFFYSPKEALQILQTKLNTRRASSKKDHLPSFYDVKVGDCFDEQHIQELAKLMRTYYSSCLWKKGDILLVDNRQVMHAGMPGKGPRLVRAMICNPLDMKYSFQEQGVIDGKERFTDSIGCLLSSKQ